MIDSSSAAPSPDPWHFYPFAFGNIHFAPWILVTAYDNARGITVEKKQWFVGWVVS
jgi:hypothetical protein